VSRERAQCHMIRSRRGWRISPNLRLNGESAGKVPGGDLRDFPENPRCAGPRCATTKDEGSGTVLCLAPPFHQAYEAGGILSSADMPVGRERTR